MQSLGSSVVDVRPRSGVGSLVMVLSVVPSASPSSSSLGPCLSVQFLDSHASARDSLPQALRARIHVCRNMVRWVKIPE